jgi:hypothetical protein
MKITAGEMTLIKDRRHGKPPRRAMRIPVSFTGEMIQRPCPFRRGSAYTLSDGERIAYITVTSVEMQRLGDLDSAAARLEGYTEAVFALGAFAERWGSVSERREVWVISFMVTSQPEPLSDDPVFLAKVGDYTNVAGRQAVPGDPEVCILPGEGERARVQAIAAKEAPTRKEVENVIATGETLRSAMLSMKARNRAALIVREAEKLRAELLSSDRPLDVLSSARAAG